MLIDLFATTRTMSSIKEAQQRLHTNPLRILDSKNSDMQDIIQNAPSLLGAFRCRIS